jgi:gamma-glutamyltranspeptidase/glutathione hydrolase
MKAFAFACVLIFAPALQAAAPAPDADNPEPATGYVDKPLVHARRFMAVTANPWASQAAALVLKQGGSAVDAAIAAQLTLGVVEPQSSGLGGGGFIVHYDAAGGALRVFDGRETAPAAAREDYFLRGGKPLPFREAINNGRAVGAPGLLRGLELAHRAHGKLPWKDLFSFAIALCEQGFPVSPRLHALLRAEPPFLSAQPAAARHFYAPDSQPWPAGHVLKNPALAALLRRVADEGPDAFYQGAIARDIVAAVRDHARPGELSEADLANYRAIAREPLCGAYRGYQLCGAPPPSSGPLAVLQILGMLEQYPMNRMRPESAQAVHYFSEAGRLAYADRDFYAADPAYVQVPVARLLDPAYLKARGALIQPDRAMGAARPGDPAGLLRERAPDSAAEIPSTTHLSVVDAQGNVVSMTTSIESAFGSKIFVHGFLLNNEMTDFAWLPRDAQGRPAANRVEPGKRPRSAMSPMIVLREGKPYLAIGSPGGPAIINYVAKTLAGVLDWGLNIQQAIGLPNMGSRGRATELERGTSLLELEPALRALGHRVRLRDFPSGLHGILIGPDGGLEGGADPRREGVALGE